MQVRTIVCGKTALIASGKPFNPSTTPIRTSLTPRFFNSFTTRSQNLAPSVFLIHRPTISFLDAERDVDGLLAHHAFVADLDP